MARSTHCVWKVGVDDGARSWEEEPMQVPGENKRGSWERDFKAPHLPASSLPGIDSESEFAPFSPGIAHPYNDFYSLALKATPNSSAS